MEYIYAGMLIHKLGHKIEESAVKRVIEAAGGRANEAKTKALVAALQDVDINKAIKEASVPMAVAAAPVAGAAEAKPESKKEDDKKAEEAAAAGLGALFG